MTAVYVLPWTIHDNSPSSCVLAIGTIDDIMASLTTKNHTCPIIDDCERSHSFNGNSKGSLSVNGQACLPIDVTISMEFGKTLKIIETIAYQHDGTFHQTGSVITR